MIIIIHGHCDLWLPAYVYIHCDQKDTFMLHVQNVHVKNNENKVLCKKKNKTGKFKLNRMLRVHTEMHAHTQRCSFLRK